MAEPSPLIRRHRIAPEKPGVVVAQTSTSIFAPDGRCPYGQRRFTNNGPARCAGGYTESKCRCNPPPPTVWTRLLRWLSSLTGAANQQQTRAASDPHAADSGKLSKREKRSS
jgi:hypothetical protein